MNIKNLFMWGMVFILWFFLFLAGCNSEIWENPEVENVNRLNSNLPNNEVVSVMKDFLKDVGKDAEIKEDTFSWLNYAEYDYNNYEGWYYDITWYSLSITGVKDFPNVNKVFDGWYVHYVWDEIWGSAIDYSKDNILCSYFLSLEQEIPYELMNREWDYEDEEERAAYDKAWSDFYDIASYSVELSCGYLPEWIIQYKDFNYYAEWMEPFWYASFRWEVVNIFTPDGVEDVYVDKISLEWDDISFEWYSIEWKLEKAECIDGWEWDTHEYKISFDTTRSLYWDDGMEYDKQINHYEWCADRIDAEFVAGEEWTLDFLIKKTGYEYQRDFAHEDVSYAVWNIAWKYMLLNIYEVKGEEYDSYQVIMEKTDDGWKVLYEWDWNYAGDEKCEELNQYDNNLMDLFFLKSCPRG